MAVANLRISLDTKFIILMGTALVSREWRVSDDPVPYHAAVADMEARVAAINKFADAKSTTPFLDAKEWAALKRICAG